MDQHDHLYTHDHQQILLEMDTSQISQIHHHDYSNISTLSCKFGSSSKQRTRQQTLQEINKRITTQIKRQMELKEEFNRLKKQAFDKYLSGLRQEFDRLNEENAKLRAEIKMNRKKNNDQKYEQQSNRSSLKPRSTINKVYNAQNIRPSIQTYRKQINTNMILKKKQQKITESTANLLGRSQVVSPLHHKRKQSQLTQRKQQNNMQNGFSVGVSMQASFMQQKSADFALRKSFSRSCVKYKPQQKEQNVFVKILQGVLKEEKMLQQKKYGQLYLQSNQIHNPIKYKQEINYIEELQSDIRETNDNIAMLSKLMSKFQQQVYSVNINLKNVDEMTSKLLSVKGRYIQMEKRCEKLHQLREQVELKQQRLETKRQKQLFAQSRAQQPKNITSIQTMIKIILNNPHKSFDCKSSKLYHIYFKEIREMFKWQKDNQNKRYFKIAKVKETIDSIRESRQKFNEIIKIYEDRITKLQEKISRFRNNSARIEGSDKK